VRFHPPVVHEARRRWPFYSALTLRPAVAVVNTKGARSRLAGNGEVGARRVRTQRNEQNGRGPTLANKVSGKAPCRAQPTYFQLPRISISFCNPG